MMPVEEKITIPEEVVKYFVGLPGPFLGQKKFIYKCPVCKKHFKLMHKRSEFEFPGKVECFKCFSNMMDLEVNDKYWIHHVHWERYIPFLKINPEYSLEQAKVLHSAIENERWQQKYKWMVTDQLYTDQWPKKEE